ncbi:MAG: hypothetical protein AB9860_01580 [Methanomassiliicoccales archaeon]
MRLNEGLSPRDEVLLASLKLTEDGKSKFTEWDLTVECWKLNKKRWGLPGYWDDYPNHKRVMNELMAQTDRSVLTQGLLVRTSTNMYALTTVGRIRAESLTITTESEERAEYRLYDALKKYLNQTAYIQFKQDRNKPTIWLYVASFYDLSSSTNRQNAHARLSEFEKTLAEAEKVIGAKGENSLRRRDRGHSITEIELSELRQFHETMRNRFPSQFKALLEEVD